MTLPARAALPVLVLLPLLAGCSGRQHDPRALTREEVLVTVSATGQADSTPDQARFSAGVSSIGATGPAAGAANAAAMNKVVSAMLALGIEKRDIQTRQLSISRIDYGRNRGRFEASNVVAVTVRKVERAGAAAAAATGAGANVLSGPDLSVGDPEAAGRSAYAAAYKEARARAEAYAGAAGLKVARVLSIDDGSAGGSPTPYGDFAMERAAAPRMEAPPVFAGTNTSTANVRVSFALGPKPK